MFKVPEDHIGLIFEYMARLCALARKASPHVYLKEQQTFFESFLKPWVGTFCKMIRDCSETGFYQGLARLTEGFMALEAESLEACKIAEHCKVLEIYRFAKHQEFLSH